MNEKKIRLAQIAMIAAAFLAALLAALLQKEDTPAAGGAKYAVSADLNGQKLAVVTGSEYAEYAERALPDSELIYVTDWADTALLVSQGKAEGFMTERADSYALLQTYSNLTALPDVLEHMDYSFVMQHNPAGEALAAEFNAFLAEYKASGAYDALHDKWVNRGDALPALVPCASDGTRGVLRVASSNDWTPYCYVQDGETVGLFYDIVHRFCEWAGYTPAFDLVGFGPGFAGVVTGKYDLLAYGYVPSAERAEEVTFTDPLDGDDLLMLVRKDTAAGGAAYTDFTQLDGKLFAEEAGTISEMLVMEHFPGAPILYVGNTPEVLLSVSMGKADACILGDADAAEMLEAYPNLTTLPTDFSYPPAAFATAKTDEGRARADEFNAYYARVLESGELNAMQARWYGEGAGDDAMPDYTFSGENGTLSVGIVVFGFPESYIGEKGPAGYFVDLILGFCAERGYTPKLEDAGLSALSAGLASGKYDILAVELCITPERQEQMTFTDPVSTGDNIVAVVRGGKAANGDETGFFEGIAASFEKNFLRENRWRMMLSGLCVTLALALSAALFGTLLGALMCGLSRSQNPFAVGFARMYVKLFQGMPIVVVLLLLYYVVFGKTDISAFLVCAFGFSLDFSAYAAEIFRTGIEAVPAGQQRAALALGFSRSAAFQNVVLPQAVKHILPVYRGQFIAMVKTTAVAGYISVQDLTKVSDIIRSRTYEAFFPLISTAVIYYLLAALLVSALRLIERRTDPLKRSRAPKGVTL